MLELRSIAKRLGEFEIADISLTVEQGEYFVLLGPSGTGKTVLIEIIAGLMSPDSGEVLFDGQDITHLAPDQRGFAIVYQQCALFPHLSVAGNIAYGPQAAKVPRSEVKRHVAELADLLGIADLLRRRTGNLSGGESQRVAIARALAVEPKLLLLDEPLSSLDPNTRGRFRKELKRINRQLGTTIIHVTHDPQEAMVLGDRVGVMLSSRIRQVATPEHLFRTPSDVQVAEFLGIQNVLAVDAVDGTACKASGVEIQASSANDSTSHIWVRPEEILLSLEAFDSSARNQLRCTVAEWEPRDSLVAVRLQCGRLSLTALVTPTSFNNLGIEAGAEFYATFKSSAVHCF